MAELPQRNDPGAPLILCFGDSWIQYPFHEDGNLANRFLDFGKFQAMDIVALAKTAWRSATRARASCTP